MVNIQQAELGNEIWFITSDLMFLSGDQRIVTLFDPQPDISKAALVQCPKLYNEMI